MEWKERTQRRGDYVYLNGLRFDAVKERVKKKRVDSSQFPLHLRMLQIDHSFKFQLV